MIDPKGLEQAKQEMAARLEEYKALRSEIAATLSFAASTAQLTLAAAGVMLAGAPFVINSKSPILFLGASYVFYLLAWTQLRYQQVVFNLSEHIIHVVAPGVRKALSAFADVPNNGFGDVLSWENSGRRSQHSSAVGLLLIEGARYIFPLFAGLVAAGSYIWNRLQIPMVKPWDSPLMWANLALNCGVCFYSALLTLRTRSQLRGLRPRR